jgi:AraC-like DNA-binding protein
MTQMNMQSYDLPEFPLVSAASLVNFCDVIADYGVDGELLLRRHQLHPQFVRLPNAQVRYDRLVSLLDDTTHVTNCPHFGLLLGSKIPVESIDLVLLSSHSDNFGEALVSIEKYQRIFGRGFTLEVDRVGDKASLKYFHDNCMGGDLRSLSELAATAMLSIVKFFLGDRLEVESINMDIQEPADVTCYHELPGRKIIFGSECVSVNFPASLLSLPLRGNKRMRDIMLQYVENQLVSNQHGLVGQVSNLINVLLPSGRCCIENVADVLGIHRRTLQKKLNAQGVTFKDILRDKREEKAVYLLTKTELGLQDIAASLGYSETANFLHAFKRWLGQSPTAWRKSQQQEFITAVA